MRAPCDIVVGDVRAVLPTLPAGSARCCVTSPPYWGLRDYGVAGQLGMEATPEEYVANLVAVFREVRRVLTDNGTLWLNLGDTYAGAPCGNHGALSSGLTNAGRHQAEKPLRTTTTVVSGLKPKDLAGIPWRVAFALQADGWYLRSDIIWAKPNPMPESVTDRPTKAHEYVFLLSKSARYYYDAAAIRTVLTDSSTARLAQDVEAQAGSSRANGVAKTNGPMKAVRRTDKQRGHSRRHAGFNDRWDALERDEQVAGGANARTVWTIATQPYKGAHFATFPEELARRCILAGSAPGDTVLDPFGGSGTVGQVATGNGRRAVLVELNPAYARLAVDRVGPVVATMREASP